MFTDRVDELLDLAPEQLEAHIRDLFEQQRSIEAEITAAVGMVDARKDYKSGGHRSTHAYVKATINCDGSRAARLVRRARTINEHPSVGDALSNAHIGVAQADRLARAAQHRRAGHRFGEFADQLIGHAEHLKYADFDTVVSRFEMLADPDGAYGDDEFQYGERTASVAAAGSGVHVTAHGGTPLQAAEIIAVFRQAEQAEFEMDCATRRSIHGDDAANHPLPRTAQQRKFDAMYAIFVAYVTVPTDGVRPDPLVNIVIDQRSAGEAFHRHGLTDTADVFAPPTHGSNEAGDLIARRCETSTGVVIHPDIALRAMLTGHIRRVVLDSAGVIVDMGRKGRLFTGLQRDAAQLLVTTCAFDGCSVPADYCEIDHMTGWAEGDGETDQRNACPLCGVHNRHKYHCGLRARRAADGRVRLIRPDGSVIKPVGERDPQWADPDPPTPRAPLLDDAHLVSWDDWIRSRPHLQDVHDLGYRIYQINDIVN